MDEVDLILEKASGVRITTYLEENYSVPSFREFRFMGRDFLVSDCPLHGKKELPFFWVYGEGDLQFFRCDYCNNQGSLLDLFSLLDYLPDEVQEILGLKKTPGLEHLAKAQEVFSGWSDEGSLPSINMHDFVGYDSEKKVYYISWFPYPESPVYRRHKGKVLTDLWEAGKILDELEEDYLALTPVEEGEEIDPLPF
jgi:hypothetical protein